MQQNDIDLQNDEIILQEVFKVFFYRINLILYSLIVCILLSVIYILATPKIYISSTFLEFPVNNVSVVKGNTFKKNYSDAGIRDFYTSSENIENAKTIYESEYGEIPQTNNLAKNISANFSGRESEFLNASFKNEDKIFAKEFLVSLNKSYIAKMQEESTLAYDFISNEIPKVKEKLSEAEENLALYKKEKSDVNFYSADAKLRLIEGITEQINSLKIRELELKEFYNIEHPLYQTLLVQMNMLEKEQINIQQNLNDLTLDELKLQSLKKQIEIYQNALDTLITRQITLSLDTGSKENFLRVNSEPSNPSILYKEKIQFVILVSLFVEIFIFAGILIENFFFARVKSPDDLKKIIKFNRNYLGEIVSQSNNTVSEMNKFISNEILKKTVFSFKENIQKNTISTVISLDVGAGKTYTSLELFKSLSELGNSVCLVDTDIRKKTISRIFFESTKLPTKFEDIIKNEEKFMIKNSLIVPAIEIHDPALYHASSNFQQYLQKLKTRFDYVIIDTPSLELFVDAKIMCSISDAIVYVAKIDQSNTNGILKLMQSEFKNNKNIYYVANGLKLYKKILNYNYSYSNYYYGYGAYSSYFGNEKHKSKLHKLFKNIKNLFKKQ